MKKLEHISLGHYWGQSECALPFSISFSPLKLSLSVVLGILTWRVEIIFWWEWEPETEESIRNPFDGV